MSDRTRPSRDDELLSAYLAGDLSDADSSALEARLADDPALAADLDRLAGALMALRAVDDVTPPEGYEQRLRQRLERESAASTAPVAAGGERSDDELASARRRREQQRRRLGVATAAAAILAAAVLGGSALVGVGGGGMGATGGAADSGGEGELEAAAGGGEQSRGRSRRDRTRGDETASTEAAIAEAAAAPVVRDSGVDLNNAAAVRARYEQDRVELLGTPIGPARRIAARYRSAVRAADAFASGLRPAACLDSIAASGAAGPVAPVEVESVTYRGKRAVAYVLVGASPASRVLDRVEVQVLAANGCRKLLAEPL